MDAKRWIIFFTLIVVIFGGLLLFNQIQKASLPKSDGSKNFYGKLDSNVTLTEFVDFQCEACYAFYPTVKEVKEKYNDTVKFQVRYFPISTSHQYARLAAGYAQAAANQGKFWEMHDMIFENQKVWQSSSQPSDNFDDYAKELKLDMKKLNADRGSSKTVAIINADLDAVQKLGGNGTPTFALNGKKIDSPDNSVDAFSAVLDKALSREVSNDKN